MATARYGNRRRSQRLATLPNNCNSGSLSSKHQPDSCHSCLPLARWPAGRCQLCLVSALPHGGDQGLRVESKGSG
jgi:hypothetical protein